MQIILLDKIVNLGGLGEQVNVKAGYARNYLVPRGKAVLATKKNVAYFEARRTELARHLAEVQSLAEERAKKINELGTIIISAKAGEEGKLFGSITSRDIADTVTASGVKVAKSEVRFLNGIVRTVGEYEVAIQVHNEVCAMLNVIVVAEV